MVELKANRLWIDGLEIPYEAPLNDELATMPARDRLGDSVWYELAPHGPRVVSFAEESSEQADFGPVTLGEDEFLVLGDNRDESSDSREFGPVRRDEIRGQVVGLFRGTDWMELATY